MRQILPVLVALSSACDYEAPLNDNFDNTPANVISGTLVYAGDEPPSHTVVLLFDATNPPPPAGTGRPITFATVPADAFTDDGASGLRSAPFSIPYVADTTPENGLANGYLVTAVMDMDHNFLPLPTVAALGGSTFGDWAGTYVTDLVTLDTAPLFVEGGAHLEEVTVLVGQRQPLQRPAFTTVGEAKLLKAKGAASIDPTQVQLYRLRATGVHTTYSPGLSLDIDGPCPPDPAATCGETTSHCKCDPAAVDPSEAAFWVWFVDEKCEVVDADDNVTGYEPCEGGDGKHDPYPAEIQAANGLKDTWPRIYIEWVGAPVETKDGVVFDDGGLKTFRFEGPDGTNEVPERWVGESFPLAFELNFGGPGSIAPEGATFRPFPVSEMNVTWSPVVRHYHEGGRYAVDPANGPYDLLDLRCRKDESGAFPAAIPYCDLTGEVLPEHIPSGAWRFTMITHTGQTWTLPNEIGMPAFAAAAGLQPLVSSSGDFDVANQGAWLTTE